MRLRGWSLPVEFLSATSLTKAVSCPEAWRRRYLLKERERVYPDMFLGSVDHAVAAENLGYKMETGKDLDLDWIRNRYAVLWDEKQEKETPVWDEVDEAKLQSTGLKMAEAWLRECAPRIQPVQVEERFEQTVKGVPFPIVGYIDCLTADRVVERKTSKAKVTTAKPNWRFQGRCYQLFADLPVEWQVVTSQKEPQIYTGEEEPGLLLERSNPDTTLTLIRQIAVRLNDMYERYGKDGPWPTDGMLHPWLCGRCGHRDVCPAWIVGG